MTLPYNCFDMLVYPSGAEGFGLPVLEAMAAGTPVVYSNYSGHADFAVGLPVRVTFTPDRPHSSMLGLVDLGDLLSQVLRLVDEPELRQKLRHEGLQAARHMTRNRFTPRWQSLLLELAGT